MEFRLKDGAFPFCNDLIVKDDDRPDGQVTLSLRLQCALDRSLKMLDVH
jgi:hypothetical protein